jgi:hypothetical protein
MVNIIVSVAGCEFPPPSWSYRTTGRSDESASSGFI